MHRHELLIRACKVLAVRHIASPKLSAELFLAHVLGVERLNLLLHDEKLSEAEEKSFWALIARHMAGEPISYILGHKEFYGLNFHVDHHTLIPRPETELIINLAIEHLEKGSSAYFVDLGTGSGNIGLTLAHLCPLVQGVLIDVQKDALLVARDNCRRLGLEHKVNFLCADLASVPLCAKSVRLVVANPPYIAREDIETVALDVLEYEPHKALFSPNHGLWHLDKCCKSAARLLEPCGYVILEHGASQGAAVRAMLKDTGFSNIATHMDLAGLERVSLGQKK